MTQTSTPSVALVGCGQWGRNIARTLANLGALKLVCDTDGPRSELFARSLGADFTPDIEQAIHAPGISAIALATPAVTHAALAQQALHAGKHVFVEKPIALSIADANEIATLARRLGRVLMVGHLLQYHPVFIKLLRMVRDGQLGKLQYIYSNRLNQGRIRTEENALWSLAPHDLSMILALAGEFPTAVYASAQAAIQSSIPDLVVADYSFRNGLKAHVFCSWLNAYKEHRLVVTGDKGMAVFLDSAPSWEEKLVFYPHVVAWGDNGPEFKKGEGLRVAVNQGEPLRAEMQHFLECVAEGKPPRTDSDEAISVLRLLEATQHSMDSGDRTVIS